MMYDSRKMEVPPTPWFVKLLLLILATVGLAASIYLHILYMEVHDPSGQPVDSFCAISEGFNCVTVATSAYSAVLGIPLSLIGTEYFSFVLLAGLLSLARPRVFGAWESLLFWLSGAALGPSLVLGLISKFVIRSMCLMCMTVYAMFFLSFLLLLIAHRRRLAAFALAGPRELWTRLRRGWGFRAGFGVLLAGLASQLVWVPGCMGEKTRLGADAGGAAETVEFPSDGLYVGRPDARFTIEEFTDFECPYCGRSHDVMVELMRRYPQLVRMRHYDYPMDQRCNPYMPGPFHQNACRAALYARCAAKQQKYFPVERRLFANRTQLREDHLQKYARQAGLDMPALARCLLDPAAAAEIDADIREAKQRGIEGTPTYYINGETLVGYRPLEAWEDWLKAKLGHPLPPPATKTPQP